MPEQRYFEDVDIGDEWEELQAPSSDDVQLFLNLNAGGSRGNRRGPGDGRFDSKEGAANLGLAAPIIPGSMSFAMMNHVVTDWAGIEGVMHSIDVSYRRPVHHDDVLKLQVLVTDTTDDDEGPRVKLDVYMENERGERPVQGTAVVELPHKP